MDYSETNILKIIVEMRLKKCSKPEIAEAIGYSTTSVHRRLEKLCKQGRLTEEQAFGYRGKRKCGESVKLRSGKAGKPVFEIITVEEASRLGEAVATGGYDGYNEFLVELLRDWIAEEDAKKKTKRGAA